MTLEDSAIHAAAAHSLTSLTSAQTSMSGRLTSDQSLLASGHQCHEEVLIKQSHKPANLTRDIVRSLLVQPKSIYHNRLFNIAVNHKRSSA